MSNSSEQAHGNRVDFLRQKLQQYNDGIANAMRDLASAAASGSSTTQGSRLVPPALSGTFGGRSSLPSLPVNRDLGAEFLAAEALRRSRSSTDDEVRDDGDEDESEECEESEDAILSGQEIELLPREEGDVIAALLRRHASAAASGSAASGKGSVNITIENDEGEFEEVASKPTQQSSASRSPSENPERQPSGNEHEQSSRPTTSCSPPPVPPSYTFADLENAYHRVNAVADCAQVLASFRRTSFAPQQPSANERLAHLVDLRVAAMEDDKKLRGQRAMTTQLRADMEASESDMFAMLRHVMAECDNAKRHFQAVYERKALLYSKEKQLEQLAEEMSNIQLLAQRRRQTVQTLEQRLEQRRRALKRREEAFQVALAAHSAREEGIRRKVEVVEELNSKISAWDKILETRESELQSKESRLKQVKQQLQDRSAELRRQKSLFGMT